MLSRPAPFGLMQSHQRQLTAVAAGWQEEHTGAPSPLIQTDLDELALICMVAVQPPVRRMGAHAPMALQTKHQAAVVTCASQRVHLCVRHACLGVVSFPHHLSLLYLGVSADATSE